ncbi:hypothetical protein SO802_017424 [Lithocarpus litseifolius]|uniref:CCHC-type domain-containing protein n=1 Tax=Lithocarpus litseifolius TaxID=425828 RepID=A0AAW2CI95_9ROSI
MNGGGRRIPKKGERKEKDEELILFRELHKREKDRNNMSLLQPVSDEYVIINNATAPSAGGNYPLYRIPFAKKAAGTFESLATDNGKNDYDWLKTPPATPLFPSLEMEATAPELVLQKELPITRPPSRVQRLRQVSLTPEEGEVIQVRSEHHKQILEECSLSLLGEGDEGFLSKLSICAYLGSSVGLPFDRINEEAVRDIGKAIGRVIEVDCKAIVSDQARFLHIRVEMPIDKPIRRGAPVLSPEGDQVWVAFQYERLLGLCFQCGLLGHEAKSCTIRPREGEETPYGEWLRAGFPRPKFQQTQAPPTPPCRDQGDSSARAPPMSGHTPETPPVRHMINGINEGVIDIHPVLNEHKKPSVTSQDNSENSPDFMMHTEINGIEHNPENHGARLVSVPISSVDNVERKDSKTLANTSKRESRDTKQKPNAKTPKFKKTPRLEHDATSKPMVSEGLVGKKRTCEVEYEVVEGRKCTKTCTTAVAVT